MKQYKMFKITAFELEEILENALAEKYPEIIPLTKDNFDVRVKACAVGVDHEEEVRYITLEIPIPE